VAPRSSSPLRLLLLWLAGIDLRLTILAVPPVLPLIHRDLGLGETAVAALTGLPVLLFGLVAIPGSLLIARIGARRAMIASLCAIAIASALRGVGPSVAMLFATTFVMGAGVAVLQPALPSIVSRWFPAATAGATAVYANGLLIGEAVSASLTIPLILPWVGGSWEASFVVWAVPVLLTAVLVATLTPQPASIPGETRPLWWPDWRDARTWRLGLLQGGASALYFACNAFIPDYFHATGRPELIGDSLSALNTGQLPASLIILLFARRLSGKRAPFLVMGLIGLAGLAALFAPHPVLVVTGAAAIGFSAAFVLILTLALPPLLAAPGDVHRLSAGMFSIGYSLAFIVPLLGGALWDLTQVTAMAFLPGAVGALVVLAIALLLRPRDGRA
jgi:MFS transporter, CP family, cyanate transporter